MRVMAEALDALPKSGEKAIARKAESPSARRQRENMVLLYAIRMKRGETLAISTIKGKCKDDVLRTELHDELYVPEEYTDVQQNKLLRWLAEWKSDLITYEDFYTIKSEIAKFDPKKKLVDVTVEMLEDKANAILSANPIFVRQMRDIGLPEDIVIRGISDLLKMNGRLQYWLAKKIITLEAARDFDRALIDYFSEKEYQIRKMHTGEWNDEQMGTQIYFECMHNRETKFNGAEPLDKMVEGAYHMLAEMVRVGWPIGWQEKYNAAKGKFDE